MSVQILSRVWQFSSATGGGLLALLAIADFANDDGVAWPSLGVLAKKARLSVRQLCTVLDELETAGELKRERSSGGRNQRSKYIVTVTENCEEITVKKQQRNNNSVVCNMETVKSTSHAINRHRTVNKTEPHGSVSFPTSKKKKSKPADPAQLAAFNEFYQAYPRHVARAEAEKAWLNLNPDAQLTARIMSAVLLYADVTAESEARFIKHPASWLNAKRWEDEEPDGQSTREETFVNA